MSTNFMNHETQESAHSQIHFLRAKLSYLNTCSNMLLNLKGAFAAYRSWVNPSPEKYWVELWVLQGKFLPARLLCPTLLNLLIFFQSLEHLIGASWSRVVPDHSFMVPCESRTSTHYPGFPQKWNCGVVLNGHPIPLRGCSLGGIASQDL